MLLAACTLSASVAMAQASFATPPTLTRGDRASVMLEIESTEIFRALLITPVAEGAAVEVARGRLFMRDGEESDGTLRVPIPIIAADVGAARLTAR
ncbi:MAG: hypothetical protein AAF645_28565, partial [Myxococcota bacterium]